MISVECALQNLMQIDSQLEPYSSDIALHLERYNQKRQLVTNGKSLLNSANGHLYFGIHPTAEGWVFREWLPGADAVWLYGDFNEWNRFSHPLTNLGNGVWELQISGKNTVRHGQFIKLLVGRHGRVLERNPAYIRRAVLDERDYRLCGQVWFPDEPFVWTDVDWYGKQRPANPLIYEAHIGMAQEKYGIGTYLEFADCILPRIAALGYNTIQLMAIQEHPYYASFGYQVTNFFAPSHHFGTPEDLKYLINKAHTMGIAVLLDVVHSHACPNEGEGLHLQDGTEDQYFLYGERGWHSAWKTRCFDYGKGEVLHFLLSNLKYWQDEFHFDGFRFDGVTSMLYEDHGLGSAFTDYGMYFSLNTNVDARAYLMLANELVHANNKKAITIAEDMSGMPGMCLKLAEGGFGFDYRLSMGIPDLWIKVIKEQSMEDWDMGHLWYELTTGRPKEKTVAYCESHDQAMVGDKTIIFRLADAEMYTGMNKDYHSPQIDTAVDMHKLIRFLTLSLAKNGYLNFMGNEFGHPEWIDFPREGNCWSYHYARRQWSLVENDFLKYQWLNQFDADMMAFTTNNQLLAKETVNCIWLDQKKHLMIFERNGLLFVFNLHPTWSQESVFVHTGRKRNGYQVVFTSDDSAYGGQNRVDHNYVYHSQKDEFGYGFRMYVPCRTVVVLKPVKQ
ncbi:MAG: alpha amylase C-terminal domain-containing protein [Clostridia bacterium]|nr:alpha amylase C-terminal domain-containing protein [Clostridia bacterium]